MERMATRHGTQTVVVAILASLAMLVTSCSSSSASGTSHKLVKTIDIPYIDSVTGPGAGYRLDTQVITQMFANEYNSTHKSTKIKITTLDPAGNGSQAIADFRQAVLSDPPFILCGLSADCTPIAALANRAKVPLIGLLSSVNSIATQNRPWVFDPWPSFVTDNTFALSSWERMESHKIKSVVIASDDGFIATVAQAKATRTALKTLGLRLASSITFPTGETNFAPIAERIASIHPEGIVISATPPEAAGLARALRAAGITTPLLFEQACFGNGFSAIGNAADGSYGWNAFEANGTSAATRSYVAGFERLSGGVPPAFGNGYDALELLSAALHKVKLNAPNITTVRNDLRKALGKVSVTGTTGATISFNSRGIVDTPPVFLRIGPNGSLTGIKP